MLQCNDLKESFLIGMKHLGMTKTIGGRWKERGREAVIKERNERSGFSQKYKNSL